MKEKSCSCGTRVPADAAFCPQCGARLTETSPPAAAPATVPPAVSGSPSGFRPDPDSMPMRPAGPRTCATCGTVLPDICKFCPECGVSVKQNGKALKLVVHSAGGTHSVPLDDSPVVVGTGAEATVRLEDRYASKRHCQFTPAATGGYAVEDLGSANGTFARLKQPQTVSPGDAFLVGVCLVTVEEG